MTTYTFFATTPKNLELLLVDELRELGATDVAEKLAAVTFKGTIETAYKACLWSRLANRILLVLKKLPVTTPDDLYHAIQTVRWDEHFSLDNTFAVRCVISKSTIDHTLFAAQKIKDAIVDQFRDRYDERPNVSKIKPDVLVYVYLHNDQATIAIDLSGESLHRRGYRTEAGEAPLKENLAAAILLRAGWKKIAESGGSLLDPMCGSGTLLIEAMMMAANIAPGLNRDYFGFLGWKHHKPKVWQKILSEAKTASGVNDKNLPKIIGYDQDKEVVAIAIANVARAGFAGKIHVEKRDVKNFMPVATLKPGLVVTNPPYGERLGEIEDLRTLYAEFGASLKAHFAGWQVAVFTGNVDLGKEMKFRANKYYALFNGAIPCKLLLFDVHAKV